MRIDLVEIERPIPVVATRRLLCHRRDPDRRHAERLDVPELVDDSLQVAALPPAGAAEDAVEIVRGISVAKSIRHHEIDRFVAPIQARGADAAGRYGPEDDARRQRETDHAGDSTAAPPASTVTSASPRG